MLNRKKCVSEKEWRIKPALEAITGFNAWRETTVVCCHQLLTSLFYLINVRLK